MPDDPKLLEYIPRLEFNRDMKDKELRKAVLEFYREFLDYTKDHKTPEDLPWSGSLENILKRLV